MTGTWPLGWAVGDVEIAAQYGKGWGAIFDSTLGGSAANVDITSIVGTYAHLMLVVYARGDTAASSTTSVLRFNNDSAANYDWQGIRGTGATTVASENFAQTSIAISTGMPANTAGANLFGVSVVFIPNYAGANNKAAMTLEASKIGVSTGNMFTDFFGGFWRSNAAITRITLLPGAGNYVAGTRVSLYAMGA